MNLYKCLLTGNDCYKSGKLITPKGVMVHSTGANNPNLKRYVQPAYTDENYYSLISLLGANDNSNDWNRSGTGACVHAFIGKLADGSIATMQTLPWNMRGWHCGADGNNTHISFEICEDGLKDGTYFATVYLEAVELTAHLCKLYELDPLADGVVICHSEGYSRGIATNHADVMHWFPNFGYDMDAFRQDVAREMENDMFTYEDFKTYMQQYREELRNKDTSSWAESYMDWAVNRGLIQGDDNGRLMAQDFLTREQLAAVLQRFEET